MAYKLLAIYTLVTIAISESEEDVWADTYFSNANATLALQMCEANAQPLSSFPACFVYIRNSGSPDPGVTNEDTPPAYSLSANPEAIPCGNDFGDIWAPDYQLASCCSGDGRYFVMTGQIGAFDLGYATTDPDAHCLGYATALTASICSPYQGKYIRDNTLFVCKSACDTIYDYCGAPGENFPEEGTYTDGTTLCEELWGGFGFDMSSGNCGRPDGPFCKENIGISVVENNGNCLSFVRPNFDLSSATEYDYQQNKYCPTSNDPNIDNDHPCNDIINALNQGNQGRRLSSTDKCGSIPMYARDEKSREIAIKQGCFSSAVLIAPMTFILSLISLMLV
eukprot:211558_1